MAASFDNRLLAKRNRAFEGNIVFSLFSRAGCEDQQNSSDKMARSRFKDISRYEARMAKETGSDSRWPIHSQAAMQQAVRIKQ